MQNPLAQFTQWFAEAKAEPSIKEPTAMTLATATADGAPSARIVLLKDFDAQGFVFYTNTHSRKGDELKTNPRAALTFYWMPLDKQVRIEGTAERVSEEEADTYFASRDRLRQAGAWASLQSQPLDQRGTLLSRTQEIEAKYKDQPIPRPPHWSGYRVVPHRIEFWQQIEGRLHVRDCYTRSANGWDHTLLYP